MRKVLFLVGFYLWLLNPTSAQEKSAENYNGLVESIFDSADGMIDFISSGSWIFIPAITYAPETHLGLGSRAIKVFKPGNIQDTITRPSTLPITFLYTLNKQLFFTTELNLWRKENSAYLNSRLELSDYPFQFFGIGNSLPAANAEHYATRYFYFHINYEKRIAPGLYFGPHYEFRLDNIYQKQEDGMLANENIAGNTGQRVSGLGLVMNYDTRDNIFQPRRGVFHQISYIGFHSFYGSNFTFSQYQADFRKYLNVQKKQVLVGQAWYSFTTGNPPFQHISLIGGSNLMRGYFEGRYRDNHAMVYQTEYRLPVYRNFGLVIFGSAGQVAENVSDYAFSRFRYGGGLGFRYSLNEEGLNIRLDIAFGDQRSLYFGLNEAL